MQTFSYPAVVVPDDDGFTITFPAVPEAIGAGDDRAETLEVGIEVLTDALLTYVELGRDIPSPNAGPEGGPAPTDHVAIPAPVAAKLAVWQAWKESGISKTEFADRLGVVKSEVQRILDPDHPTKLPKLEAALAVLGKRLVVSVEAA
ncbi:antitoxin HicB [Rhodobium orientis]|uniref:HicB family protein n=1 Tax=Rhodobium orientis TaxID=34017 RepID=A0A327JU30_9HYPH|nr:type II toxin-antitoxin system HicB family antitoxin [Rhodobium orientis]MBB4301249.1 antitoxin HicB [Rhodobium orientis]MBK5951160.1 hypothetical protein [Rhodobium orientis]RAI29989.1 hypothetical protein CH339_00175 [Rhodobium orientis]